jgi:hypothetical protein
MKVAIMQPYFLPYAGYFSLIKQSNRFILLDTVQFIRHGWIERNRILKPNQGWQYIAVPLEKHSRETLIKDIRINSEINWNETLFRQLEHYKKKAPFYNETVEIIKAAMSIQTNSVVKLNQHSLRVICDYIGVKTEIDIFSEMHLDIEKINAPDEWALNICKAMGNIDEYRNPEGGMDFFHKEKYERSQINLKFVKMNMPKYSQRRKEFEEGLSIIDMLMFNKPKAIIQMLDDFQLI